MQIIVNSVFDSSLDNRSDSRVAKRSSTIQYKANPYPIVKALNDTELRENIKRIQLIVVTSLIDKQTNLGVNGENHNHDPKLPENVQTVLVGLKRRVLSDIEKPIPTIYDEEVKKFRRENGSAATIPVFDSWKSTLYSVRKSILPPVPTLLSSIEIPRDMHFNNTNQPFLFYNSPTPHKVIAFASEPALKILSENHHWNADGTFRTSPALFTQAYYIHVFDEYSMKPVVYACCEDKSQAGYDYLFRSLVGYAAEKKIVLNPKSILIDFEQVVVNTINDVFPQTSVKACHFHFAKNVWKRIKTCHLTKLSKQENIRRQIANIISLPMVPQDEINHCMERIIDELLTINTKFDKLTDYIVNNYIDDARFPFDMWNHFDSLGQRPRTNNHLEGYHRQLNARVRTNPDLWTWINEIRSSEESVMCRVEQEQAQKRSTRSRKARYARDDEKLKLAKTKYMQDKDFDAYQKVLRALSHRYINVIEDATDSSDEDSFH
ncbi:unnamed protein product [Rotaria sordida]|uniref:MULE transposase domain-containing protein n=1 Tax=Rotaria sordida TaxID=392033 RepID=A0A814T8I9_9BILA|nr:unnamed protein product [Rotaria sordida]